MIVVKKKYSVYCRTPYKENRQLMLKRAKLPDNFKGRFKKNKQKEH